MYFGLFIQAGFSVHSSLGLEVYLWFWDDFLLIKFDYFPSPSSFSSAMSQIRWLLRPEDLVLYLLGCIHCFSALWLTDQIATMFKMWCNISNFVNRKYKLQQKASMMLWKIDAADVIMMESSCLAVAGKVRGQCTEIVDYLLHPDLRSFSLSWSQQTFLNF